MSDNTPRSLMPYYRFAQLSGIDPLHAMQVFIPGVDDIVICGQPILQHAYQDSNRMGRDDICGFIAQAEDRLAEQLGYDILPTWRIDKSVQYTPNYQTLPIYTAFNQPNTTTGLYPSLRTRYKYVQYGGREATTLIQLGVGVVYTDVDGDGYKETATITLTTTLTNAEELAIYYPGQSGAPGWEVRPITPSINTTTGISTITCRREQLVRPELLESYSATGVNGLQDTNFLTSVDVYRHYTDVSQMAQLIWEPLPLWCGCFSGCNCTSPTNSSSCLDGCAFEYMSGCIAVRDAEAGIVYAMPGTYDSVNNAYTKLPFSYGRAPDRAHLWYKAGWIDNRQTYPNLRMDPKWERVLVGLTLSQMNRPISACPAFETQYAYYSNDIGKSSGGQDPSAYQIGKKIDNPFGTKVGELLAWEAVRKQMLPV